MSCWLIDLGPLGLYEEIYKARACARDSCTSCATENTDYLTVIIGAWFKLVEETRLSYGILDKDSYNFNETGFIIGIAVTLKVIINSNIIGRIIVI